MVQPFYCHGIILNGDFMAENQKDKKPDTHANKTLDKGPPLKIGELLIRQGLLKKEDVDLALALQEHEKKYQELPLGRILVEMGCLTEKDLNTLLAHPDLRKQIGALAVKHGFITEEQLQRCLEMQKPDQLIGQVFVQTGLVDEEGLKILLKEQLNAVRLGELAVKLKMIKEKALTKALQVQKSPRKLGEILCDSGLLNPLDLNQLLAKYNKQLELGEILVSLGYIGREELNRTRIEHNYGSEPLGELMVRRRYITQEQYLSGLSKQFNIPHESLSRFSYAPKDKETLGKMVSQKYAETNLILPLSCKNNNLVVALFRPDDLLKNVFELKRMYNQFNVSCVLITKEKFEELFEVLYSRHLNNADTGEEAISGTEDEEIDFMTLNLDEELNEEDKKSHSYGNRDLEAEEMVNFIVKYGILNNASDIHIEQDRAGAKLRYRFDGILRETNIQWLNEKLQDKVSSVISRIKIMSNLDIAEKRLPQDGGFRINYYDKAKGDKFDLDFRVAVCRASVGENVTIRILDPRRANVGLENLHHSDHVLEPLKRYLKSPAGMILVCGPTGSGKSSTLYAALQYLYNPGIKIITAEDPIEYNFPGVMQTQVNPKINLTFARLLRSFLRLDPDVILIGEMRDEETAKIGFDAAQTGHLILSTLHTNDALSSVTRLLDLKVEYGQIASCLMGALAQRLIRKTCEDCKKDYSPPETEWSIFFKKYPSHLRFFKGEGCPSCHFTGYNGRTLISEMFSVDTDISSSLKKGYDAVQITRLALESGMRTMLDDGLKKLDMTTLTEIIRVVPYDMIKDFRSRSFTQDEIDNLIDDLLNRKESSPQTLAAPVSVFEISNPEVERSTIDRMKSRYDELSVQLGKDTSKINSSIFKDFVMTHFYKIQQKHFCKTVSFEINLNDGKVDIAAIPGG